MEGEPVAAYKAIRSNRRRRGYVRLPAMVHPRPSHKRGCRNVWSSWTRTRTRTRRFWKPWARVIPKVRIFKFIASPKKVFRRLRDGYMGMMMRFASSSICTRGSGGGGYYRGRAASYIGGAGYGFGKAPLKEYDRKVIVEMYRSVITAAANGKLCSL